MRKLLEGIRDFQGRVFDSKRELFRQLAHRQTPLAMFITCSDSRVVPDLITRTDPGDLFTLRNAGNLVPAAGDGGEGEAATIEYAVRVLEIPDIIVCGHSQCGAMQALWNPQLEQDFPTVAAWVNKCSPLRERVAQKYGELSPDERLDATVKENVLMQLDNLRTHPAVRRAVDQGALRLHGWVFSIGTGDVLAYDGATGEFACCYHQLASLDNQVDSQLQSV
jgi:carbonic anhydrase